MSRIGSLFQKFRRARTEDRLPPADNRARWVVAGLGNPDNKYQHSRHNIGFMVLERIAAARQAPLTQRKFKGLYGEIKLGEQPVILIKPQTYYNLSGESVAQLVRYLDVPAERLIVVHDELDLETGRIRIKIGGGDAGNRGVRSVAEALGTPEFIRVRVGISHPRDTIETIDHILTPMSDEEAAALERSVARAAEAVEAIIAEGLAATMNRYNQKV
jgi:peptidyl-tRNA hydrolase, PTH1 family